MFMSYPIAVKLRILTLSSAAVLGLTLSGSFVAPVLAQGGETLEEVTVTGSRIVRRDFESNSPIVTIEAQDLESKSGLNIESYLNQLPNYNPAGSPVTTCGPGANCDVQITPVNSVGVATISLRGFGPNRNLVLVDGKRPTPINALMVTDINQIPSAMIQRVETITGGASAVYGADAVGGVTNFILRSDFEGLEMDVQYSLTEAGDGEELRTTAIAGTDVADGRGNITVGIEYYDRKKALNKERNFFTDAWSDPIQEGNFIGFNQGINGYNCGFNCPTAAVANALFPNRPAGTTITNPGANFLGFLMPFVTTFNFNADGTIWFNGSRAGFSKFDQSILDGQKYTLQNVYDTSVPASAPGAPVDAQELKYNLLDGYTSGPQERYSFMINSRYDITDEIEFFGRASYAQSKTRTLLAGNNAIFGWEANIPYNPATDSPIDPLAVGPFTPEATVQAVLANPAAFANPGFIAHGQPGAQHPVPLELAILLNSRLFDPAGPFIPHWNTDDSWKFRNTFNTNQVWQIEGGLNVDLPIKDWTGELYVSHGESSTYNINTGNMSLARYRALAAQPDYGRGAVLTGNGAFVIPGGGTGNATLGGFGAGDITCTSGFYDTFFSGEQRPSEDCVDAIDAILQSRASNQQNILEINLQGGIMDLPAGELRGAAGFQYRENNAQFLPDILQSQVSFLDQVVGVYPTGYLRDCTSGTCTDAANGAKTSVKDFYMEALVPILKDLPYLQKLELETGARYSDYNVAESTWTYKFLGNAQVNDWLRLRGGYNRATRAPNLGELFLNLQEVFQVVLPFGDPCGWQSNSPFGAASAMDRPPGAPTAPGVPSALAGGQTTAGALSTYRICLAQMSGLTSADPNTLSPGATAYYTGAGNSGASGGLFNWVLQEGNPNLTSEKADTFTAGFTITSPIDNPWFSGLQASIDWWKVDIKDAIQQYSINYGNFQCYGAVTVTTEAEALTQAATPACRNVPRSAATGGALTVTLGYDNLATIATSGIDFGVNWNAQLSDLGFDLPGGLNINVLSTWLDYYKTKESPEDFDLQTEWVGSLGPTLTGTNAGAYDFRVITNFTYSLNNWNVNLRWRHLPSVITAANASQNANIAHNESVAAGGPGFFLSYVPGAGGPAGGPFLDVDSHNVLDLSFTWNINEMFSLRGGIDNIIDFAPETTMANDGYPAGTNLSAVCGGAPGCVNPTAFTLGSPGAGVTNGGYYDTLGRRFFLGLKAQF
jgi:outer membrane receptor protein involved in Fe transport